MKTSTTTRLQTIAQPRGEELKCPEVANGQQTHEPPLQLQHLREGESPSPRRQRTIADIAQPRVKARRINSKLKQSYVLRQTVLDRMVWTKRQDLNLETLSREMLSRKQTHLLRSTSAEMGQNNQKVTHGSVPPTHPGTHHEAAIR
jgi:hypothetical protein